MASSYSYPEDYWAWFIEGNRLGLVQNNDVSSGEEYASPDEDISEGCLIKFYGHAPHVNNIEDEPLIDKDLHRTIINYVKWKLAEDGNSEADVLRTKKYFISYKDAVNRWATRDKIGGIRQIVPYDFR